MKAKYIFVYCLIILMTFAGCYADTDSESTNEIAPVIDNEQLSDNNNIEVDTSVFRVEERFVSDRFYLDPGYMHDYSVFLNNMYEGLFTVDKNNNIVNGMCSTYEVNTEKTIYTFNLKEDVYWSNGDNVTAHDFVYSWRKLLSHHTNSDDPNPIVTENIRNLEIKSVDLINDFKFKLTLYKPVPYLINNLSGYNFIPIHKVQNIQNSSKFIDSPENLIVNGPFLIKSWIENNKIVLTRNPYYKHESLESYIQEIHLINYTSKEELINKFNDNELDYISDFFSSNAENETINQQEIIQLNSDRIHSILFHLNNKYASNDSLRKSILHVVKSNNIMNNLDNNKWAEHNYLIPTKYLIAPRTQETYDNTNYSNLIAQENFAQALLELNITEIKLNVSAYNYGDRSVIANNIKNILESTLSGLHIEFIENSSTAIPFDDITFAISDISPTYFDANAYFDIAKSDNASRFLNHSSEYFDDLIEKTYLHEGLEREDLQLLAEDYLINDKTVIIPLLQPTFQNLQKENIKGILRDISNDYNIYKFVQIIK